METIQVDYDPQLVSYSDLLHVFFTSHDPSWSSPIRQYASAIFYHDDDQKGLAEKAIKDASGMFRKALSTELLPYSGFTRAEDYHQKYYLKNTAGILKQYKGRFPSEDAFTDSTAVARVNGYIGGNGTREQLEGEAPGLGLSGEAVDALREILKKAGK